MNKFSAGFQPFTAVAVCIMSFSAFNLHAQDRVFLKNATVVEGSIIREDSDVVVIKTKHGEMQIQRKNVESIVEHNKSWAELFMGARTDEQAGTEIVESLDAEAESKPKGETKQAADSGKKRSALTGVPKKSSLYKRKFKRAAPELEKKIIENIHSANTKTVSNEIKEFFKKNADAATPYLVLFMWDQDNYYVALNSIKFLGELGRKDTIKYLVEALYAMTPLEGHSPGPGIPDLMDAAQNSLDKLTADYRAAGIYADPNSAMLQEEIARWLEWYAQAESKLPPQVGEKPLPKKDAPDYPQALEKERGLDVSLRAQSWPVPAVAEVSLEYSFPPVPAKYRQRLDALLKELASPDDVKQRAAESELELLPPEHIDERSLTVYLTLYGLTAANPEVRKASVQQMGRMPSAARPAIKFIIEAMMKTMGPKNPPKAKDEAFFKSAFDALEKITGIHQFNAPIRRGHAYDRCYKWVEWYQSNRGNAAIIPPQLGEPKLDPAMKNYAENYLKVRSLALPNLPPE